MSNVETLPVATIQPLTTDEIRKMNAYWRACNYLSAGMLYLCSNPLLRASEGGAHQEPAAGPLGL